MKADLMSDTLQAALAWAERGFRVFRVRPGRKEPFSKQWFKEATDDRGQILTLWGNTAFNVGVSCDDMVVVDCDVKRGKTGLASYIDLELPSDTLAVKTPTGGVHYYLAGAPTRNRAELAPGIDIRSFHGYVIAPGSRLYPGVYNTCPAGGAYALWQDEPMAAAPDDFLALVGAPRERTPHDPLVELDTATNVALASSYLAQRDPAIEGAGGDDFTYKTACGVRDFGVSEEVCNDLLLEHWNDRCAPPWEPEALRVKVENAYSHATGGLGAKSPEHEFANVDVPEPETKPRTRSKIQWAGAPLRLDRRWLYYDRLPESGTALLVAPSGAGKTFVALELAKSLATGSPFFGVAPDEQKGAVFLVAEGVSSFETRAHAIGQIPVAWLAVNALIDAREVEGTTASIQEAADAMRVPLGMIVVDTLAASGLLADENSNTECAKAVKALEQWARRFNCLVLVTHHPPKNGTGARGGSALHAGFDTVMEIYHEPEAPVRYLACTKARDAETGKWGSFTLTKRVLALDHRGKEVKTCDVSMGNEVKAPSSVQPKHFDTFDAAFDCARAEHDLAKTAPVPREVLSAAFRELAKGRFKHSASASTAFRLCLQWAAETSLVTVTTALGQEFVCNQRPAIGD
jgi:hypothetical protein